MVAVERGKRLLVDMPVEMLIPAIDLLYKVVKRDESHLFQSTPPREGRHLQINYMINMQLLQCLREGMTQTKIFLINTDASP